MELSAPLETVSEEMALGNFIHGLRPEVRVELRILEPTNLGRAMDLAQLIEEKLLVSKAQEGGINQGFGRESWGGQPVTPSTETNRPPTSGGNVAAKPIGEVRRLTESEAQRKREKGLCYRCDDKWAPGHRCRKKELSVLLTQDERDDKGDETELPKEGERSWRQPRLTRRLKCRLTRLRG